MVKLGSPREEEVERFRVLVMGREREESKLELALEEEGKEEQQAARLEVHVRERPVR